MGEPNQCKASVYIYIYILCPAQNCEKELLLKVKKNLIYHAS